MATLSVTLGTARKKREGYEAEWSRCLRKEFGCAKSVVKKRDPLLFIVCYCLLFIVVCLCIYL